MHQDLRATVALADHVRARSHGDLVELAAPLWRMRLADAAGAIASFAAAGEVPLDACPQDDALADLGLLGLLRVALSGPQGLHGRGRGPFSLAATRSPHPGPGADGAARRLIVVLEARRACLTFAGSGTLDLPAELVGAVLPAWPSPEPCRAAHPALARVLAGYRAAPATLRPRETWQEAAFREHADLALWKDAGGDFGADPTPSAPRSPTAPPPSAAVPPAATSPAAAPPTAVPPAPVLGSAQIRAADRREVNGDFRRLAAARRSRRDVTGGPVSVAAITAHLSEVRRFRSRWPSRWGSQVGRTSTPSAGALHPLDAVLLVFDGEVEPGAYRYDPEADVLHRLSAFAGRRGAAAASRIRYAAAASTGLPHGPAAVLVLCATDAVLHGKYRGFAYANAYKDAGAILTALQYSAVGSTVGLCPIGATIEADVNRCMPYGHPVVSVFGAAVVGRLRDGEASA
ncbi:SagB/ThcOx family dehydrogenase [Nonomuraea sp. PA05]|uniref:nitroreductase family protein n=1 Tax=Nonomuraea sp. PA05 TaxID=2604466 RepID=UPI0011D63C3F|nr:nitroreductase family protein [Nonomuraea sp. PA05]TYB58382.1 SagB/ThcOx family dehydrogenase [Nonomuraea sp. PA05]